MEWCAIAGGKESEPVPLGLAGLKRLSRRCSTVNSLLQCLLHTRILIEDFERNENKLKGIAWNFSKFLTKVRKPSRRIRALKVSKPLRGHQTAPLGAQVWLDSFLEALRRALQHGDRKAMTVVDRSLKGMYQATVICPDCLHVSVTSCDHVLLKLVVPPVMRRVTVTILPCMKPVTVDVPCKRDCAKLVSGLRKACKMDPDPGRHLQLYRYAGDFLEYLAPGTSLSSISDDDTLVAASFQTEGVYLVDYMQHVVRRLDKQPEQHEVVNYMVEYTKERIRLPPVGRDDRQSRSIGLDECIQEFMKKKRLKRPWFCHNCKHRQGEAVHSVKVSEPPDVLLIRLKNPYNSRVESPVHVKLREYLTEESHETAEYELYAFVKGHCRTAIVKVGERWYSFKDRKVTPLGVEAVDPSSTCCSTILFYTKLSYD